MTEFQKRRVKGKIVTDNLFMHRALTSRCRHVRREFRMTFYDIDKFCSLWLQDCIKLSVILKMVREMIKTLELK